MLYWLYCLLFQFCTGNAATWLALISNTTNYFICRNLKIVFVYIQIVRYNIGISRCGCNICINLMENGVRGIARRCGCGCWVQPILNIEIIANTKIVSVDTVLFTGVVIRFFILLFLSVFPTLFPFSELAVSFSVLKGLFLAYPLSFALLIR